MLASDWKRIVRAIGVTVRDTRALLGWSQNDLATRAVVSQGAISRLEAGKPGIPFHTIVVVLRALALGADGGDLPLAPTARTLLAFVATIDSSFTLTSPALDTDLVRLLAAVRRLSSPRRLALLTFVEVLVYGHAGLLSGRRLSGHDQPDLAEHPAPPLQPLADHPDTLHRR